MSSGAYGYVPIEIGRSTCILSKTNIKLQSVPPSMPLEALLIPDNLNDSEFDGIYGGTNCNFLLSQNR